MGMIYEHPSMAGSVCKTVRDKKGNIIFQETDHNLIVASGKDFWLRQLAGDKSSVLSSCILGNGGAPTADPFNPIAPATSDRGLVGPTFYSKTIGSNTISGTDATLRNSVTFSTTFTNAEVNFKVSEAGLFYAAADALSSNGYRMFARHTFSTIDMTSSATNSSSLEIAWTIYFS